MKEQKFSTGSAAVLDNKRKTGNQTCGGRAVGLRLKDVANAGCHGHIAERIERESSEAHGHDFADCMPNDLPFLEFQVMEGDRFPEPVIEGYVMGTLSDVIGDLSDVTLLDLLEKCQNRDR